MFLRLAVMTAALFACGRSKDTDRATPVNARASAPPASTQQPAPWRATEVWRTGHPVDGRELAVTSDGTAFVASTFEGELSIGGTFRAVGEEDLVVHRYAPDGTIGAGVHVGGKGGEAVEALVAGPDAVYLALRASDAITIAGKPFTPPKPDPEVLHTPTVVVVVTLDLAGKVTGAFSPYNDLDNTALAVLPGGDLAITGSAIGKEEFFGHTEVLRVGPDGAVRWKVRIDGLHGSALVAVSPTELALSIRADKRLGFRILDAATGKTLREHVLVKAPSGGDLGDVSAVVRVGDTDRMVGSTEGDLTVDGKLHEHGHLNPFVLAGTASGGTAYTPIADLTTQPIGAAALGGELVAAFHAIHTGKDPALHRGLYLVLHAGAVRLVPLYQYAYEGDNWEHAPKQHVLGKELHADRMRVVGDALWFLGRCDERGKRDCLVKFQLAK